LQTKPLHFAAAALAVVALAAAIFLWQRPPARYFAESEVDHRATPLRRIDLEFPPGREGIDYYGTLRLDVYIGARGEVDRVDVIESHVPGAYLDSAVRAFATARFEPAQWHGRSVKSVKKVEVKFAAPLRGLQDG
jgi:TonB family protein